MLWVYKKLRMVRKAFCTKDSPRQMAAGLACGLLLGLLPKGNLVALAVASMLLATRMSLATGMLCAFLVSLVAPLCDPLTHRIGEWVLTNASMATLWRSLSRLPLMAWTSLNNTVVMGSLWLGLALMAPAYRLSLPWMERLNRRLAGDTECDLDADDEPCVLRFATPGQPPEDDFSEPEPTAPQPEIGSQDHSAVAEEEERCA